jgi:hypothetical protein
MRPHFDNCQFLIEYLLCWFNTYFDRCVERMPCTAGARLVVAGPSTHIASKRVFFVVKKGFCLNAWARNDRVHGPVSRDSV